MQYPVAYILSISLLCFGPLAAAEVVKLPDQAPQVVQHQNAPQRGMDKHFVSRHFGQPQTQNGPVGDPPIYRWDYEDYSVFFEGDYVLHSVVHSH